MDSRARLTRHVCDSQSVWFRALSMGRGGRCSLGIRATLPHCKPSRCRQAEPRLNRKNKLQQIVGNTIGMPLRMYAHLSMYRRALQNSQRARIRCNWCACLSEDFSAARVATKEIFGRAESCGQGEENCSKLVLNRTSWSVVELRRA